MGIELRNYQTECIQKIKSMEPGEKLLVGLPTGTGKTVIFSSLAENIEGRTLIVVPSTEIRQQTADTLKNKLGLKDVGQVQQKLNEVNNKIVIATRQSLTHKKSNRLNELVQAGGFAALVFDEVHEAPLQTETIINNIAADHTKILGFTATPYNPQLKEIFGELGFSRDIKQMIKQKYLVSPRTYMFKTKTSLNGIKTVKGDFATGELENRVNSLSRNKAIVKQWKTLGQNRQTIVFSAGLEHNETLKTAFTNAGIEAATVTGADTAQDREQIIKDFKNGKIKVLINYGVLTRGFDYTGLGCVVFASPTKSLTKYVQCLGRGLRPDNGKSDCIVLDFVDNYLKNDVITMSDIFNGLEFKNGETLHDAEERTEQEQAQRDEEYRLRMQQLAEQRRAQILQAQAEQLESYQVADLLDLVSVNNQFEDSYLYIDFDNMLLIKRSMAGGFAAIVPAERDSKNKRWRLNFSDAEKFDSVEDAVNYIVTEYEGKFTSWSYKNAAWKKKNPSPAQKIYLDEWQRNTFNKWDCIKHFNQKAMRSLMFSISRESTLIE